MNYKVVPKADKTNLRNAGNITGAIIGQVGIIDILEGDNLVKDSLGRDWLEVLIINGMQTSKPTFIALWVCNVAYAPPLPPVDPLPFQVGLNIVADSPLRLSRVNSDGTRTEVFSAEMGEYVMEFIANDSNAPFIRME